METSAKKISRLRKRAKMSEQEAAVAFGVTVETLRRWERGIQFPRDSRLTEVCAILRGMVPRKDTVPNPVPAPAPQKRLVNRFVLGIDSSGSMRPFQSQVPREVQKILRGLRDQAKVSRQVTDVVIVMFSETVHLGNVLHDIGSMTDLDIHAAQEQFIPGGGTALYDAVVTGCNSLERLAVGPNDSVSYVVNFITDGFENASVIRADQLKTLIADLQGSDAWTFCFQFPEQSQMLDFCKSFGVPVQNCKAWSVTEAGLRETAQATSQGFGNFYASRTKGATRSMSFYTDLSGVSPQKVDATLARMEDISKHCQVITVPKDSVIRAAVEAKGLQYTAGCAYYQLVKTEARVQDYKHIIITKVGGAGIFHGAQARHLLGLPSQGSVRIVPGDHAGYDIYVQSTSYNRKIPGGTKIIYYRP